MADPELRKLLEYARPVREFSQAIQTSFRLIEMAISAESSLENLKARAAAATKEVETLEARRGTLAQAVAAERESLLVPIRAETAKLAEETASLRKTMDKERTAFDEEHGRRTSVLRQLDDQARDRKARLDQEGKEMRETLAAEKRDLLKEISDLKAEAVGAADAVARLRSEYRAVQEAAARLVGR